MNGQEKLSHEGGTSTLDAKQASFFFSGPSFTFTFEISLVKVVNERFTFHSIVPVNWSEWNLNPIEPLTSLLYRFQPRSEGCPWSYKRLNGRKPNLEPPVSLFANCDHACMWNGWAVPCTKHGIWRRSWKACPLLWMRGWDAFKMLLAAQ